MRKQNNLHYLFEKVMRYFTSYLEKSSDYV